MDDFDNLSDISINDNFINVNDELDREHSLLITTITDLKEKNKELERQNNVYKVKLLFYEKKMLELDSENKKIKKKIRPNFWKRFWYKIIGKKYSLI